MILQSKFKFNRRSRFTMIQFNNRSLLGACPKFSPGADVAVAQSFPKLLAGRRGRGHAPRRGAPGQAAALDLLQADWFAQAMSSLCPARDEDQAAWPLYRKEQRPQRQAPANLPEEPSGFAKEACEAQRARLRNHRVRSERSAPGGAGRSASRVLSLSMDVSASVKIASKSCREAAGATAGEASETL